MQALATGLYEITFTVPLDAVAHAPALSTLESTLHISPTANVQVQAEVSITKEGEIKVTKLFLVLGNLAIQLTGG